MNALVASSSDVRNVLGALRSFARRRPPEERCELCGEGLAAEHPHVLQRSDRRILCACDPCAILFSHRDENRRFIRIPREGRCLEDFDIEDADWNALRIPIDLAFFLRNSAAGRVIAYYPSPAGPTESLLDLEAWEEIMRNNAPLEQMQPDVEALLVDRTRGNRRYFIAPIDQCYKLTGLIRMGWRGFSGGDAVWREVDGFFELLRERCRA